MSSRSNFRHAQYGPTGTGIDDPQKRFEDVTQDPATGALVGTGGALRYLDTINDGVVLIGDSIGSYNIGPITVAAVVDNNDGTATVTASTGSLESYAGDLIQIEGSPTARLNVAGAPVIASTIAGAKVTALTYRYEGLDTNKFPQSGGLLLRLRRRGSDQGFLRHAKFLTNARFRLIASYAIGGMDSEQVERQILARAIAQRPRCIVVQFGTNNVYARGFTAARSIASFKRIADAITAAGIVPVFSVLPPRQVADTSALTAANSVPLIRWMREYLPSIGGYCVDMWARSTNGVTMADLTNINGASNTVNQVDGIHWNRLGAWGHGKAMADALRQVFPERLRLPVSATETNALAGKLFFANTLLTGTAGTKSPGSGTITGNAPTGLGITILSGNCTVTLSQIPRTDAADGDAAGNWLRLVITGAASGHQVLVRAAVTPTNWAPGDLMQGGLRVRTSSGTSPGTGAPTGLTTPELVVNVTSATSGSDFAYETYNQTPGAAVDEAASGIFLTEPYAFKAAGTAVHGSLSYIRLDLNLYFRASGDATVDIAHPLLGVVAQ